MGLDRVLLKKYIEYIRDVEGVDFIDGLKYAHTDVKFTDEEIELLESISKELDE